MEVIKRNVPPKPIKRRNTAIYCRVSTSAYDQIHSLTNQIEGLMDYVCTRPDLKFYDLYVDVLSGTGKYERRNMNRLIKDCVDGNVQYVVTKSISRFARDTVYLLSVVRELKTYGVEVYFQMENISSFSPDAELYLSLYGGIAQAESEDKSDIIKWGMEKAKANPYSRMNNKKFYGYEHDADGKLIINEAQAEVVKKIFKWYIDGESIVKIIKHLSDEGIPSPRGNEQWSKKAVENILDKEEYTGMKRIPCGINMFKLEKQHHAEIISVTEFQKVKEQKAKRSNLELDADGNLARKKKRYQSP